MNTLRQTLRTLLKRPGYSALIILMLAIGIGANTMVFSVINRVYFKPLPFADAKSLMHITASDLETTRGKLTPVQFLHLRDHNQTLKQISGFQAIGYNVTGIENPVSVQGTQVSGDLFNLLRIQPELGRLDLGNPESQAAVISMGFWRRAFEQDTNVIGRNISLNGQPHTIIGVLPEPFHIPVEAGWAEIWTPRKFTDWDRTKEGPMLSVIARLDPGATRNQAQAEIAVLSANQPKHDIQTALSAARLKRPVDERTHSVVLMLSVAVIFVLIIACANTTNLSLARALDRRKEFAIRYTIGAAPGRIIRQLLTEQAILTIAACGLGLHLARWGRQYIMGGHDNVFDTRVALFTVGVAVLIGLLCSLLPAIVSSRANLNTALKAGGKIDNPQSRAFRLGQAFIIGEVALSLALLIGAGLLVRTVAGYFLRDPGFATKGIVEMHAYLPPETYRDEAARRAFYAQRLEELKALPETTAVSITACFPIHAPTYAHSFEIAGQAESHSHANINRIDENYFSMMNIPLQRGRDISAADRATSQPVAVIDQTTQRRHFLNEDPIGKTLNIWDHNGKQRPHTIVGVVANVINIGAQNEMANPLPVVYVPYQQWPWERMTFLARTEGDPATLFPLMQNTLRSADPSLPAPKLETVEHHIVREAARHRPILRMLGIFATLGLLLAALGVFGIMSYSVARRTHEIGIRMAVGARRDQIRNLILKQGLKLGIPGILLGCLAAASLTNGMKALLYGVSPLDPITFASVAALMLLIALAACYLPARRAVNTNPIDALRHE